MASSHEASGSSGGRGCQYTWPYTLGDLMVQEFASYDLLVPRFTAARPLAHHPMERGGGLAVPPLPEYDVPKLEILIYCRWLALPDELKDDPKYSVDNHGGWLSMLTAERN